MELIRYCSMLRLGSLMLLAAMAMTACAIDVEGIKQGADQLKQEVESSNLMECKDEDGEPLPEWICRKDSGNQDEKEN